jgi:hypothetical protein
MNKAASALGLGFFFGGGLGLPLPPGLASGGVGFGFGATASDMGVDARVSGGEDAFDDVPSRISTSLVDGLVTSLCSESDLFTCGIAAFFLTP